MLEWINYLISLPEYDYVASFLKVVYPLVESIMHFYQKENRDVLFLEVRVS